MRLSSNLVQRNVSKQDHRTPQLNAWGRGCYSMYSRLLLVGLQERNQWTTRMNSSLQEIFKHDGYVIFHITELWTRLSSACEQRKYEQNLPKDTPPQYPRTDQPLRQVFKNVGKQITCVRNPEISIKTYEIRIHVGRNDQLLKKQIPQNVSSAIATPSSALVGAVYFLRPVGPQVTLVPLQRHDLQHGASPSHYSHLPEQSPASNVCVCGNKVFAGRVYECMWWRGGVIRHSYIMVAVA